MKVLVVFHGWLPEAGRPMSGGALRAWHHIEALRGAGHELALLTRDQDQVPGGPPGYANPRQLRDLALRARADRILCVQPEEAPALADLGVPLAVDLYAPRLLEAAFQGGAAEESVRTLRAIAAGDHFFFSNPRQRWMYLGLLALAGVDVTESPGEVLPLVAPEGPRRRLPKVPRIVMGGVAWPWQDPTQALREAVATLEARGEGEVVVYGGRPALGDSAVVDLEALVPPGPHLRYAGLVPWEALLKAYAGASLALDVMAPNPEREVALAFRQVEYLGCGLPMITGTYHALSEALREAEAGWVGGSLRETLNAALDDPEALRRRGQNARALARARFSREVAEAPLLRWVETATLRARRPAPLPAAAELAASLAGAEAQAAAEARLRALAEAEVAAKRAENAALSEQLRELTASVARLSRALDEVAGFKREAVRVLGTQAAGASEEAQALTRELADTQADLSKKDAELRAARREQDRLQDALSSAQDEARYAGERLTELGRREDHLRQERDGLRAALTRSPLARLMERLK
ncbi:MAG: glycosyltransferase [Alphaproteobacteria bacterium]|nr:glycosyltransferase [Alphaproteobacteria bacterium]MCB9796607.1 glycosyltransferase [Alphaproteobacteria bacterium]